MIALGQHAGVNAFDVRDGELLVGGWPLSRLAARVGSTPFFAYSRDALRDAVSELRASLPDRLHLHYAVKANPMPAVVQFLATMTDGLDVASAQEMTIALNAGVAPDRISFAGPGKTGAEIGQAVAAGVTINLESERQLESALEAGDRLGISPRLAIRVNPGFELKSSGMKMGGGPRQFGVDEDRVAEVARRIEAAGLRVVGFHIYAGSQNLSAPSIADAQSRAVDLGIRLASGLAHSLEWLNIGGGFGVPYFPGERPLDLAPIAGNLHQLCDRIQRDLGISLVIELGRYLTAEAGVYVTRVIDRKVSHGQTFLVVDGGLNHHLAASGNFGQVIRKNYPVAIGTRMSSDDRLVQTVVGPLCTPLDLLADRMSLSPADVGDLVVIFRSGAYGPTASPTAFLSHPPAAEVLV